MKATTTTVTKREEMDDENTAGAKIAVLRNELMQTTTSAVLRPTATNGAFLGITTYSATVPSTWATNHELTATFTYEAA